MRVDMDMVMARAGAVARSSRSSRVVSASSAEQNTPRPSTESETSHSHRPNRDRHTMTLMPRQPGVRHDHHDPPRLVEVLRLVDKQERLVRNLLAQELAQRPPALC